MNTRDLTFFSTPNLEGVLQQLKHLCFFGADGLIVEGPLGSGCSTMAQELARQLVNDRSSEIPVNVVPMCATDSSDLHSLIVQMVDLLGLTAASSIGEGLKILRTYVQSLLRDKQLCIYVFDDADKLNDEALAALLSLLQPDSQSGYGLRFVFFGLPGFARRIDALGLLELTIYDFTMPNFSSAELGRFLTGSVNGFEQLQKDEKVPPLQNIWSRSEGYPGAALALVQASIKPDIEETLVRDIRQIPYLHLVLLSMLIAGLVVLAMYREEFSGGHSDEGAIDTTITGEASSDVIAVIKPESAVSAGAVQPKKVVIDPKDLVSELDKVGDKQNDGVSVGSASVEPTREPASVLPLPAELGQQASAQADLDGSAAYESKYQEPSGPASSPSPDLVRKPSVAAEKTAILSEDERYLNSLNDGQYMLQLVAASQDDTLKAYIRNQPNRDMMRVYRRVRDTGGQWHIVLLGPYPSKKSAQNAVNSLPKKQRQGGPWPRSILSIKRDIDEFRRN